MILGFTGTRLGPRPAQTAAIRRFISGMQPQRFVHGGAPGSDMIAHGIAESLGIGEIEVHPTNERSASLAAVASSRIIIHPGMDPLDRNRVIVRRIHGLLACPQRDVEDWGSGSWATVRYARELGCPVYVILSDGQIKRDPFRRSPTSFDPVLR